MSYRIDAEVSDCSYGCTYTKSTLHKDDDRDYEKEVESVFLARTQFEFDRRSNSAVWFVSNCDSKLRMRFAASLKTYFPVKVIGKCTRYMSGNLNFIIESFIYLLFSPGCKRLASFLDQLLL